MQVLHYSTYKKVMITVVNVTHLEQYVYKKSCSLASAWISSHSCEDVAKSD